VSGQDIALAAVAKAPRAGDHLQTSYAKNNV
jgi:hypothetical protein